MKSCAAMLNFAFSGNTGALLMQHFKARPARLTDAFACRVLTLLLLVATCAWTQERSTQPSPPSITEKPATPEQMATPQTPGTNPPAKGGAETSDKPGEGSPPASNWGLVIWWKSGSMACRNWGRRLASAMMAIYTCR